MFKSIKWLYISESNLANGLKTHLLVHAWKKSVFFGMEPRVNKRTT